MIFHENYLLADDSYAISNLIFFLKIGEDVKQLQNLSSAADVIGALRDKRTKYFNTLSTSVIC